MKRTFIKFFVANLMMLFIINSSLAQTATPPSTGDGTSGNPYEIATLNNLYWITQNSAQWSKYYIQTADIDASTTSGWSSGAGFTPIGNSTTKFTGSYNGQGYTIDGLTINRSTTDYIGMFGYLSDATGIIQDLGLTNLDITGKTYVGGLVGYVRNNPTIQNCYTTGTVECSDATGYYTGGLLGYLFFGGNITESYSAVDVIGHKYVGGFAGGISASGSNINNCYTTGNVTRNSASAETSFGAFVSTIGSGAAIENSYSIASVYYDGASAPSDKGFAYSNSGTATNNFFDSDASNQSSATGATAKTTAQMQSSATFTDAGWDFVGESTNGNNDYWNISSNANNGYPHLDWQEFSMKLVFDITASDEIQIPLYGTVDCTVDWGDGTSTEAFATAGLKSHIYSTTGTYTVSIEGSLTEFGNLWTEWTGVDKLTEVKSLDGLGLTTLECAFQNADNLTSVPALLPSTITSLLGTFYGIDQVSITNLDAWDVSSVTETRYLFDHATNFNQDIGSWDVSSVTNMYNMFSYAAAFNQDISSWDVSAVENMQGMFYHADAFNQPIGTWDVSSVTTMYQMFSFAAAFNGNISTWNIASVTNMGEMFRQATSFNQPIGSWDMSNITTVTSMLSYASAFNQDLSGWTLSSATNLSYLFYGASSFDQDISGWDVSSVTSMKYLFYNATAFNQDISSWNTGSVGDMTAMFSNAVAFDQPIGSWDVGNVYTMQNMFSNATAFNQDLSNWDVSGVTNMENMFSSATAFNGDISTWNTSLVTDMDYMFNGASAFNQNINQKIINEGLPEEYTAWNVGNVTSMSQIFQNATNFNQPLGNWNVTGLTSAAQMFKYASSFNQPIGDWDVSSIENMYSMFYGATAFDQSLADWDITGVTNMTQMFYDGSGLSYQNYDATLISWASQSIVNTPTFYAGESHYTSNASAARTTLTDTYGWTIYDLGEIIPPMELVFTTTGASQEIQLPLFGTVNCTVDWGDGTAPESISSEGLASHTYTLADSYTVQISGQLTEFGNGQTGWTGVEYLTAVNTFGDIGITALPGAFRAANNLTSLPADLPDGVTDMSYIFQYNTSFNLNINSWDVSSVTDMRGMFYDASSFNQPLDNWDVSSVTTMLTMFSGASAFNMDIGGWNTGSVSNTSFMFHGASAFNQDISGWDVSQVTTMTYMFAGASAFNKPIGTWNTSAVTNMTHMFMNASAFNQNINEQTINAGQPEEYTAWDVSSVTDMLLMFSGASAFNQPLDNWNTSAVTRMQTMFSGASSFNQDISGWNTANVESMSFMFMNASAFDQNLGSWDISSCIAFNDMFTGDSLSVENYDGILNGWAAQTVQASQGFDAGNSMYSSAGLEARNTLTGAPNNWTITDGGLYNPMVLTFTFASPGSEIQIPLYGTVDCNVDWGDGSAIEDFTTTGDKSHTYASAGTYTVKINGTLTQFGNIFNVWTGRDYLTAVNSFGDIGLTSLSGAFNYAQNLASVPATLPAGITDLNYAFQGNQQVTITNLDLWDISNVTTVYSIFTDAVNFNQDITGWNTAGITNMSYMFNYAWAFNQDISGWDVSSVEHFDGMFNTAKSFNQDISGWDISSTTNLSSMFYNAEAFDQNLDSWQIGAITQMTDMFDGAGLSVANYDSILIGWAAQTVQNGVNFGASGCQYSSNAAAARQSLIDDDSWTIDDGGLYNPMELTFTFASASSEIQIPLYGTVDCSVNWGDGNSDEYTTTGDKSHVYASAGTYTVKINGTLTQFGKGTSNWIGVEYLTSVDNFGEIGLTSLTGAFRSAINLTSVPSTLPPAITNLSNSLRSLTHASITNLNLWDVSNVTNMGYMFRSSTAFNQDISGWDVGSATNMTYMFAGASAFNQDITGWDVSSVTTMAGMFSQTETFNQDISGWNVGSVADMSFMFYSAQVFDQDLGSWDISSVQSMSNMFQYSTLSTANYDALLTGWAAQVVNSGLSFHGGYSMFSPAAASARQSLIDDDSWTITDGGATETTWNGTAWSYGAPGANSNITLTGDYTTTAALECNNLTIGAGANVSANHTITVNGDLIMQSDATGTASILGNNNVTVAGNTTVQNYMEDYGAKALFWHYIAIPIDVSGGSVTSDVFGTPYNNSGTDYYALYYDETIPDYVGITDNTTFLSEQMRGYAVPKNSAETLEFTGDLVDGTQTVALSRDNTGFNLVGNPYPSGLNLGNIDAGLTGVTPTNLATTVWIRENGGFNEYNWQSGATVSGTFAGVLPPMQAAWFKVSDGQTTGSLQFENTARAHNNEIIYKSTESNLIRFSISDGSNVDNAAIGLYNNATLGMDNYDSEKMFDDNQSNPQVFMHIDNKDVAINGLPANQQELNIPIGIKAESAGNYKLSFNNITEFGIMYDVYLKDILTGEVTDLRKNHEVDFYTDAINANSRLSVIITKSTTDITKINNEVNMYYSNNSIVFESAINTNAVVSVYDVSGKTVETENINIVAGSNQIEFNQPDGIYLVNIRSDQMNQTQKIIIR